MLLDRRLNLLNIWRVCRELSAAFFWSHNSAASFHRMRCASCTRHGAALFPRKDRKRMAHRDVTAQFKLEKLGRKKKLASTTVQITKLCHCLGGWNSPSRQRGAPRTGHQFIRGPTYGAQTHTYWHQTHLLTRPACLWTVDGGRAQNRAQDLLALRQQGSPPHLPPCHSDNKY